MADQIELLTAITEPGDFHTAIFFTYGADLAFFEEAVLNPLWHNECRNILVFLDATRYADTVSDLHSSPAFVGRHYILVPVRFGPQQSFHPKFILLLGHERGRLLVGSGNCTFTGYGQNHEVYSRFEWAPDSNEFQPLFVEAFRLVEQVAKSWNHSTEVEQMLKKTEYIADWLADVPQVMTDTELFHSLNTSLLEQLSHRLENEDIRQITIVTPFLDSSGRALEMFNRQFHPRSVRLVLQNEKAVGETRTLKRLKENGIPLQVFPFADPDRYLHAKIYLLETSNAAYLATGSANCTSAAWLNNSQQGNLEVIVLRKGQRPEFDYLLKGKISRPLKTLDQFTFKSRVKEASEGTRSVELLDATIRSNKFTLKYRVMNLPRSIQGIELRFSATLQHSIALVDRDAGEHTFETDLPFQVRQLQNPVSCFIVGFDAKGTRVLLTSNEIWVTNADLLHYEISRHPIVDPSTAGLLADGVIENENEWNDLYTAIIDLVELDVSALKRRGITYSKLVSKQARTKGNKKERETVIREEDDTDEAIRDRSITRVLFTELPIAAWFDYVQGRLPLPQMESKGKEKQEPITTPRKRTPSKRQTPPQEIQHRFKHLVNRYIRSLGNAEYMQTATVHHILSYYVIFHRIICLLSQHHAITEDELYDFGFRINTAFFGTLDDLAPVRCPTLQHHIQRAWSEEWKQSQILAFALGSMLISLNNRTNQDEESLESTKQLRRILTCAVIIGGLDILKDAEEIFDPLVRVYDVSVVRLSRQLKDFIQGNLDLMSRTLTEWQSQAIVGQKNEKGELPQRLAARATVDYGLAAYDIALHTNNIEKQKVMCRDLPFWLRQLGRTDEAARLEDDLLAVIALGNETRSLARMLYQQGQNLFHDQAYNKAASKLRQAIKLADQDNDAELVNKARRTLDNVEFMLRGQV
jgi:tetratricopeptide (TPR) repeat protein